jgi:hypothetical protein
MIDESPKSDWWLKKKELTRHKKIKQKGKVDTRIMVFEKWW